MARVLRYGAKVSLFAEEMKGFVVSDGFIRQHVHVECLREDEHNIPDFERALFQVLPRQESHATRILSSYLQSLQLPSGVKPETFLSGEEQERYKQLVSLAEQERHLNKQMLRTLYGNEVLAGDFIQFKHISSDRYLRFLLGASSSSESMEVELDDSSNASAFSLTCPYTRDAGKTRISIQDHVYIIPDRSLPGFLGCSSEDKELAFQCNLNSVALKVVDGPMKFLLHLYQDAETSVKDAELSEGLRAGSFLQLFQPSSNCLLAAVPIHGRDFAMVVSERVDSLQDGSLHSLWVVEQVDPSVGGSLSIKSSFRLRNLATGGYLCPSKTSTSELTLMAKEMRYWSNESADYLTRSCFEFHRPMESDVPDEGVSEQVLFWLFFGSEEHGGYLHVRENEHALLLPSPGSNQGVFLSPVSQETRQTATLVLRAERLLAATLRAEKEPRALTCQEMIAVIEVLKLLSLRLKARLKDSKHLLVFQGFLRQSGVIRMVTGAAREQKEEVKLQAASRDVRSVFQSATLSYSMEFLSAVFQFLRLAMANNEAVCQEVFLRLPLDLLLLDPAGFSSHYLKSNFIQDLVACYLQVYQTSFSALFDINFSVLESFLKVLENHHKAASFVFAILRSLLTYKNVKLRKNAQTVYSLLFDMQGSIALPRTAMLDGSVHVCLDVDWKDKTKWRKAEVLADEEDTREYYNEFELLLSELCQNQEWFDADVQKRLERELFLSLEAGALIIADEELPLAVRTSLSLLVSTVYINKAEREGDAILDGLFVLWPRIRGDATDKTGSGLGGSGDLAAVVSQLKGSILKALRAAPSQGREGLEYLGAQTRLLHKFLEAGLYDKEIAQAFHAPSLPDQPRSLLLTLMHELMAAFFHTWTRNEPALLDKVNEIRRLILTTLNLLSKLRMKEKLRRVLQLCEEDFHLCSGHMADNDSKVAFGMFDNAHVQGLMGQLRVEGRDIMRVIECVTRSEDKALEKEAAELMLRNLDEPELLLFELRQMKILESEVMSEDLSLLRDLADRLLRSSDFLFLLHHHVRGRRQETRYDLLIQGFINKVAPASAVREHVLTRSPSEVFTSSFPALTSHGEEAFAAQAAELRSMLLLMKEKVCENQTIPRAVLEHATSSVSVWRIAVKAVKMVWENGISKEEQTGYSLAQTCIDMLLEYASSNDSASMDILTDVDLLLDILASPQGLPLRLDSLLCLLFRHRYEACLRFGQTVIKRVVALIYQEGRRFPYLKVLLSLLSPGGREVKQNQSRTFNLLKFQREETLFLPWSENEILSLQSMCRSRECLAVEDVESFKRWNQTSFFDPVWNQNLLLDSQLMYSIFSFEVLAECCKGKRSHKMKKELATMISSQVCCDLIVSKIYMADIKVSVLRFVLEVHLNLDEPLHRKPDPHLMRTLLYTGRMLPAVLKHNSNHGYCHPQESLPLSLLLSQLLLRLSSRLLQLLKLEDLPSKTLRDLTRACGSLVTFLWQNQLESLVGECRDLFKQLKDKPSLLNEHTRFLVETQLHTELSSESAAAPSATFKPKIADFASSFIHRLSALMAGREAEPIMEGSSQSLYLDFILKHVRRSELEPQLLQRLMIITLRCLESLSPHELRRERCGQVVSSLLYLISSGRHHKQALRTLNSLLRRPLPQLRVECERYLKRTEVGFVFPTLHAELSRWIMQRQSRGGEEDVELSALAETLDFIRLVCEGSSPAMQRMFHKQPTSLTSCDVLSELINLISELSRDLSCISFSLVTSATLAVRSLIKGPQADNVRLILRSNLFEAINCMLEAPAEEEERREEEAANFFEMQRSIADLLILLLEENAVCEAQIPTTMMSILNLRGAFNYCVRVYRSWEKQRRQEKQEGEGEERQGRSTERVMLSSGFQYFIFLKDLRSYLRPEEEEEVELFGERLLAYQFFEQGIARVEIVRRLRGDEHLYTITKHFQLPSIAQFVTAEIKHKYKRVLVHEDKMMQLRLLLDCTADINHEAEIQQLLLSHRVTLVLVKLRPYAKHLYLLNVFALNLLVFLYFSQKLILTDNTGAPAVTYQPRMLEAAREAMTSFFLHVQTIMEVILCGEAQVTILLLCYRKVGSDFSSLSSSAGSNKSSSYPLLPQRFFSFFRAFNAANSFQQKHAYWRLLALFLVLYMEATVSYANQAVMLLSSLLLLEIFVRSHLVQEMSKMTWKNKDVYVFLGLIALAVCSLFGAFLFLFFAGSLSFPVSSASSCSNYLRTDFAASAGFSALISILLGLQRADLGRVLGPLVWPPPCPSPPLYGCSCNGTETARACLQLAEGTCETAAWKRVLAGYSDVQQCGSIFSEDKAKVWIFLGVTALYGLVVVLILYFIFASLIIDLYKSLRQSRAIQPSLLLDSCFICGMHRNSFDPRGFPGEEQSFSEHLARHSLWLYVLFFSRILEKQRRHDSLSASEEFVLGKLRERDISFFPLLTSLDRRRRAGGKSSLTASAYRHLLGMAEEQKKSLLGVYRAVHVMRKKLTRQPRSRAGRQVGSAGDVEDFVPECVRDVMHAISISKRYSPFKTFLLPSSRA